MSLPLHTPQPAAVIRGELPAWWSTLDPALRDAARLQPRFDYSRPREVHAAMKRNIEIAERAGFWKRHLEGVSFFDDVIPGTHIGVRLYKPAGAAKVGAGIIYLHGGGFMIGDLDTEHPRCLELCHGTGSRVISIDYRLAPEHPFPSGLNDCELALDWLFSSGERFGLDPSRLALMGCSAGGCLALSSLLRRRDQGLSMPRQLLLIYPVVDDRLQTDSALQYSDTPVWDSLNNRRMWQHYLDGVSLNDDMAAYVAPARAALHGLPPCYVLVAHHDPLRDEALELGRRLVRAGVPTELHLFRGTFHGFDTLSNSSVSQQARAEQLRVLRAALSLPSSSPSIAY